MAVDLDQLPAWLADDIREYCAENAFDLPTTQAEALEFWLEWNGIVNYAYRIRHAVFELMAASSEYITTTDKDRADWLRKAAEVPAEVEL